MARNRKRSIRASSAPLDRANWATNVAYVGSPLHKRNPGNFGLTPPSQPAAGKTLCDAIALFERASAVSLLQAGACRGLVSPTHTNFSLPKYIWSVDEAGNVLEAQGDHQGHYHGYPLLSDDPFREVVLRHWADSAPCGQHGCPLCSNA